MSPISQCAALNAGMPARQKKRAPVMTASRKVIGGTCLAIMVSLKPARPLSRRHHWLSSFSGPKNRTAACVKRLKSKIIVEPCRRESVGWLRSAESVLRGACGCRFCRMPAFRAARLPGGPLLVSQSLHGGLGVQRCAATQIVARLHKVDSYRLLETGEPQPSLSERGMWLVPVCTRCQGLAVEPGPCASKPSPLPSSQTVPAMACPHPPNGKEQKKSYGSFLGSSLMSLHLRTLRLAVVFFPPSYPSPLRERFPLRCH